MNFSQAFKLGLQFKIILIFLMFLFGCTKSEKKNHQKIISPKKRERSGNKINVKDARRTDEMPLDLISEVKFIPLDNYKIRNNNLEDKNIKIIDNHIFIHDGESHEFYCYNFNGTQLYFIDLKKHQKDKDYAYRAKSYFVKGDNSTFIYSAHQYALTFTNGKLTDSIKIPYWTSEVELSKNRELIIYQGYVNNQFGKPHQYLTADSEFGIKKKYLPISETQKSIAARVGTVAQHIFRSNNSINYLTDQNNTIYKNSDFTKPYYTVNFNKFNVNPLKALSEKLPPSMYNFAMIDTFWENNNYILCHYFLERNRRYFLYNKNSNRIINRFLTTGIDDFLFSTVNGTYKGYYYSFIDPENFKKLKKIKKSHLFLKSTTTMTEGIPFLAFFKLKT